MLAYHPFASATTQNAPRTSLLAPLPLLLRWLIGMAFTSKPPLFPALHAPLRAQDIRYRPAEKPHSRLVFPPPGGSLDCFLGRFPNLYRISDPWSLHLLAALQKRAAFRPLLPSVPGSPGTSQLLQPTAS
ncbi:hypothetical protein B0H10DRAFT_2219231 [Mycena sp. CBHHK59/15]|nr:hypothetical protein B0H10DRAFT_2219231 [Mycena sp. CBHHK59/15]